MDNFGSGTGGGGGMTIVFWQAGHFVRVPMQLVSQRMCWLHAGQANLKSLMTWTRRIAHRAPSDKYNFQLVAGGIRVTFNSDFLIHPSHT
jgi:hypothetical protein